MPIGVTISKTQHRYGSPTNPLITVSGWTGPWVMIADQYYSPVNVSNQYTWVPKNRTIEQAVIQALGLNGISWNMTANVSYDTPTAGLLKSGPDGFSDGAYSASVTTDIGIQGRTTSTSVTCTLSLQSGTPTYNFFEPSAEHCMVFGGTGGSIYENGVNKDVFSYSAGDYGLIKREGSIVKYYLINGTTKEARLIRSTRSLLVSSAFGVVGLYHNGARMNDMGMWYGDQAKTYIDVYSVLNSEFQDLRNQSAIESLAESTTNKDKSQDFTYLSTEKNIIALSIDLEWRFEEQYQEFREFFQWHNTDLPFIFTDMSRKKIKLEPRGALADNEIVARFTSRWADDPLGAGLFGASVDIVQMVNAPRIFFGS